MVGKYFAWIYDNHRYFHTVLHGSMLHAYVRVVSNMKWHLTLGVSRALFTQNLCIGNVSRWPCNVVQRASPRTVKV